MGIQGPRLPDEVLRAVGTNREVTVLSQEVCLSVQLQRGARGPLMEGTGKPEGVPAGASYSLRLTELLTALEP